LLFVPSVSSAYQFDSFTADNLISWIKEGYMYGGSLATIPHIESKPYSSSLQHDKVSLV
jgi:prenyltransferase beta subunit